VRSPRVHTVDLSQRAVEALRSHRKRQMEEHKSGRRMAGHDLVFATTIGTPLDAPNIINRHFKPLLKRAQMPDIRWHDLRHTYATLLLAKGVHPKYVQAALGHASIQLTLDTYSHWMPSMGRDTATAVDDALKDEHEAPAGDSGLG
jgi:integrase